MLLREPTRWGLQSGEPVANIGQDTTTTTTTKRPGNGSPHSAAHTIETLQKLNFEVLAHHPYSPDLATFPHVTSDFYWLGPLKETLRSRRFTLD
ncbi:hypothetical protein LAZ67_5004448 [Cordylochernes scorpioides]|uniref:Histone-lysine N-methyltransferase SETMAR n=1 Tax=Cordylochernes scorpioides TaxID=51811 RepID=A0ABY6KIP0_9ARAC|nr:hypothetical protein LAZ67_5004448 [Cordylochernes scorpioides]